MGFKAGDGSEEPGDIEKITLPTNEPENKVRLEDADSDDDASGERDEKVRGREDQEDQPRRKDGTWAEKKAERGRARKEEAAWKIEKEATARQLQQMREEIDRSNRLHREELDGLRRQQERQGQQSDPLLARINDLTKARDAELKLLEADQNHGYTRYNEIIDERNRLIARHEWMQVQAQERQNQPQRSPYDGRVPIIEAEYPWLQDQRYKELGMRARAYRDYLIHVQRKPDTLDTDREALSYAQATFGPEYGLTPPAARPTQRTKDLYGGPPSRGTPARNEERMPEEVDLGPMGQGHGLTPKSLAQAVASAFRERNGTGR